MVHHFANVSTVFPGEVVEHHEVIIDERPGDDRRRLASLGDSQRRVNSIQDRDELLEEASLLKGALVLLVNLLNLFPP
jgi:hypothetical protein